MAAIRPALQEMAEGELPSSLRMIDVRVWKRIADTVTYMSQKMRLHGQMVANIIHQFRLKGFTTTGASTPSTEP